MLRAGRLCSREGEGAVSGNGKGNWKEGTGKRVYVLCLLCRSCRQEQPLSGFSFSAGDSGDQGVSRYRKVFFESDQDKVFIIVPCKKPNVGKWADAKRKIAAKKDGTEKGRKEKDRYARDETGADHIYKGSHTGKDKNKNGTSAVKGQLCQAS